MTIQNTFQLVIMDPVGEVDSGTKSLSPQVQGLQGKGAGFVFDGHPVWVDFWEHMSNEYNRLYEPTEVLSYFKPNLAGPAPKEWIDKLANKVGVAVVGVGA